MSMPSVVPRFNYSVLKVLCLLGLSPVLAQASSTTVVFDNDSFGPSATDAYYTAGLFVQHVLDAETEPDGGYCPGMSLMAGLLEPQSEERAAEPAEYNHSWGGGQIVNTPKKLQRKRPDPKDQPYSGLLYGTCALQRRSADRVVSLGVLVGVVGPWSQADEAQKWMHRLSDKQPVKNWYAQLHNEVVANLFYDRQKIQKRVPLGDKSLVVFNSTGLAVGPLITSASIGINALYSISPDATFGTRPGYLGRYPWVTEDQQPLGFYSLGGMRLNAVARNLFLDGNTWKDSPSVGHRPLVAEIQVGAGYGFSCLTLQTGLNVSSRAFSAQKIPLPHYATLSATWTCGW